MTPAAKLRIELAEARVRGEDFDSAWSHATRAALDGAAHDWMAVLAWSKFAYQDAYAHRGTARLAAAVQAKELAEVVAEQVRPPVGVGGHRLVA